MRRRVGVLISGRGSNMEALIHATRKPAYPAEIATVISNRPGASGLGIAGALGVEAITIDSSKFASREAFENQLNRQLRSRGVEYIACAGFMRLLTKEFINDWRDRILNIHPSLLPSYRGLHTHERALADGVRIHGCTVHIVRPAVDDGPIVAQAAVPVLADDTPGTLAARVLQAEHLIYPRALGWLAAGKFEFAGERVIYKFEAATAGAPLLSPAATG